MDNELSIKEIIKNSNHPLLSLEFFPPKSESGYNTLNNAVERMQLVKPDFVTVTYGAGGTTRNLTMKVCSMLKNMNMGPVMPHLTCVGSTRAELCEISDEIYNAGFRNIMTLRGDPPKGETKFQAPVDGLQYASDLVTLLKERHPEFCCGVAGYPEGHPEAESVDIDIEYLRQKVDCGADFITTQLFFDNDAFFKFRDKCRAVGITQPIIPGLLPPISLSQIERITTLCKATFPQKLATEMEAAGGIVEEAEKIGIQWTVKQINELLNEGVPAIHLYVLNRAQTLFAPQLADCLKKWHSTF